MIIRVSSPVVSSTPVTMPRNISIRLMNFHLEPCGISVVLQFVIFLFWFREVFVGFVVDVWKLLFMKACTFVLYCCVGSMTKEFPLSADIIVASFSMSFVCMDIMV